MREKNPMGSPAAQEGAGSFVVEIESRESRVRDRWDFTGDDLTLAVTASSVEDDLRVALSRGGGGALHESRSGVRRVFGMVGGVLEEHRHPLDGHGGGDAQVSVRAMLAAVLGRRQLRQGVLPACYNMRRFERR